MNGVSKMPSPGVILSAAKDLGGGDAPCPQILRYAQDDSPGGWRGMNEG
jgi:hypothetical protein